MGKIVGNRFAPTGVELINHYLKKKNLGETSLIEKVISEVQICNYEPRFLPSLSKIKSKDQTWYFFVLKEYTSEKKSSVKRATDTGFWKVTGVAQKIKNKGVEIGFKRTVYYYEGRVSNGVKTDWIMHEYHITSLPTDQRTYVICKLMYKGEDQNILSGGDNSSGSSHPLAFDSNNLSTLPEMCPAICPKPEVEQPIEEVNLNGLALNQVAIPMNEHVNLSPWGVLGPNTFSDNNNNNNNSRNVQQQAPYLAHELEDGGPSMWFNENNTLNMQPQTPYSTQDDEKNWSPRQHSNTVIPFSNTLSRVEQPIAEENLYSLSMNHFAMPVNEHVGLPPWGVLDANTFSDNNNNNQNMQLQAPYISNEFEDGLGPSMWFNNNNTLNMQPQTPYSTQDVENNWSIMHPGNTFREISNSLFEVEQPLHEEGRLQLDVFDPDTLFSDYDNYNLNAELQTFRLAQDDDEV